MGERAIPKKPCNDCPFRRKAPAGWLGANDPRTFSEYAQTGRDLPCHTTVDYEDDDWEYEQEEAPLCRGSLEMLANGGMQPWSEEGQANVARVNKNPDVFTWPVEFVRHHESSTVRSWEFDHR